MKVDIIKEAVMKEKIKKEYLRRTRKLLETKLYSRNLFERIYTWAVPLGTNLKVNESKTSRNWRENKKINDDA